MGWVLLWRCAALGFIGRAAGQAMGDGISKYTLPCDDPIPRIAWLQRYLPVVVAQDSCLDESDDASGALDTCTCNSSEYGVWEETEARVQLYHQKGFGIHLVNSSGRVTTGGMTVAAMERVFHDKLGNLTAFDAFLTTTWASTCRRRATTVSTRSSGASTTASPTSLHLAAGGDEPDLRASCAPHSMLVLELVSNFSNTLAAAAQFGFSLTQLEPRVSSHVLDYLEATPTNYSVRPVHVSRAAANLADVDDFYTAIRTARTVEYAEANVSKTSRRNDFHYAYDNGQVSGQQIYEYVALKPGAYSRWFVAGVVTPAFRERSQRKALYRKLPDDDDDEDTSHLEGTVDRDEPFGYAPRGSAKRRKLDVDAAVWRLSGDAENDFLGMRCVRVAVLSGQRLEIACLVDGFRDEADAAGRRRRVYRCRDADDGTLHQLSAGEASHGIARADEDLERRRLADEQEKRAERREEAEARRSTPGDADAADAAIEAEPELGGRDAVAVEPDADNFRLLLANGAANAVHDAGAEFKALNVAVTDRDESAPRSAPSRASRTGGARKLVLEYDFEYRPSLPKFHAFVKRLRTHFPRIYHSKQKRSGDFSGFPNGVLVFAMREPPE
ncbi:hypothetical protein JL720_9742 [Aureococcus anophagefferens]|nr:hypothetical protein JL720_9742 [Aureococcus anophagefferens]